jgi:hypothetical protein
MPQMLLKTPSRQLSCSKLISETISFEKAHILISLISQSAIVIMSSVVFTCKQMN